MTRIDWVYNYMLVMLFIVAGVGAVLADNYIRVALCCSLVLGWVMALWLVRRG